MPGELAPYKAAFLRAAVDGGPLQFGTFTLKSGRVSPYFFNAGAFYRADLLAALATALGHTLADADRAGVFGSAAATPGGGDDDAPSSSHHHHHPDNKPSFDVVFGPAYKGIPLATAAVGALATIDPARYGAVGYAFDRKEIKDHGEGGRFVGAPLSGRRVVIVDDVITAGTAKREAVAAIRAAGGHVVGIVVALDRMETLPGKIVAGADAGGDAEAEAEASASSSSNESALGALRREFGLPILAILTLDDIIAGMQSFASADDLRRTEAYRKQYKASN